MKIPVVDRNDNIIEYKERENTNDDIVRSSVVFFFSPEGEVLLARRSDAKTHEAGMWSSSAGGTIEGDETYAENIVHETKEELDVGDVEFLSGPKSYLERERNWCQFFFATIPENTIFNLQTEEVAEVRWLTKHGRDAFYKEYPDAFTSGAIEWLPVVFAEFERRGL